MQTSRTFTTNHVDRTAYALAVAGAAGQATTSKAVEQLRLVGKLMFVGLAFLSIWGASGLVGTIAGLV